MAGRTAQQCRWLAAPAPDLGRKWRCTARPHRGARSAPYRVQQTQFSYAIPESGFGAVPSIGQHNARSNVGCYSLAKLGERNLGLGLEDQIAGTVVLLHATTNEWPVCRNLTDQIGSVDYSQLQPVAADLLQSPVLRLDCYVGLQPCGRKRRAIDISDFTVERLRAVTRRDSRFGRGERQADARTGNVVSAAGWLWSRENRCAVAIIAWSACGGSSAR